MAKATTLKGSKILVQLGDGATPTETFAAPCGITTKSFSMSATANEFNVPDCDDPDAASWTERVIASLSAGISGSGVLAMESLDDWRTWFLSGLAKNVRVVVDGAAGAGAGYFSMSAVLTAFSIGGNVGELATVEVELSSSGEVVWTAT